MTTNIDLINLAKKNNIRLDAIAFKDQIDLIPYKNGLSVILNMSNKGHPGTHWIAFYCSGNSGRYMYYSDSFGELPPIEVENYCIKNNIWTIYYNPYVMEDINGINCGELSLNFLKLAQNSL